MPGIGQIFYRAPGTKTAQAAIRNVSAFAKAWREVLLAPRVRSAVSDAELQDLASGAIGFASVMRAMQSMLGTDTKVIEANLSSVSNLALVELSRRTGQSVSGLDQMARQYAADTLRRWPGVAPAHGVLSQEPVGALSILSQVAFLAAKASGKAREARAAAARRAVTARAGASRARI